MFMLSNKGNMSGNTLNSYWREITAIIEGGLKPDPHRVSAFAKHLAQRLEQDGETRLSRRIHDLTERAATPAGSTFVSQFLPADVEAQQSLIERVMPVGNPAYPVLPGNTKLELKRFVELNRRSGELASAGIEPPSSLLLVGPPGCGKTMSAYAIACDLGLPLFVVRLDSLLGSFLGNSAKNLRRVFDNAVASPSVLLLDEFDSIGKMRDDSQEVGEIKRLVGSLLQNLDNVQGRQLIIAATNHHHLLDPAVWRRFDVSLHLDKPELSELKGIFGAAIPIDRLANSEIDAIAALSIGLSGSDVSNVVNRALQDEFMYPDIPLVTLITLGIIAQNKDFDQSSVTPDSKKDLIRATHDLAKGNLTIRQIARLAGCSGAYAHEVIRSIKGVQN